MTTSDIPQPKLERFSAIPAATVMLAYLSRVSKPIALGSLRTNFRLLLTEEVVQQVVAALVAKGEVAEGKVLSLTPAGRKAALNGLGRDANATWDYIKTKRLPLLALGLDADDPDVRRRFANADALKAAAIAVAFGLPKQAMEGRSAIVSEIVWQVLRSTASGVIGKGPFPTIDKPGVTERVILSGLAAVQAKSIPKAVDALAARAVGLEKTGSEALRSRLVVVGLERSQQSLPPHSGETGSSAAGLNGVGEFAANVSKVAAQLVTPPFQDRVAIAQVYDAYGRDYPDAGSLENFKKRLVGAAKAHRLQLGRLDLPERMARELRQRSETLWDRDEVHFIITS
jgi:hypothetical protein